MSHADAVVGLQWGDEGKGKVVDLLSSEYDLIVRYNGGANAGHSVVVNGERYALHLVPSGILHGKQSVIGPGVVVDPAQLFAELDGLAERGVDTSGLVVSDRAHVVMPYHKAEDELREGSLGPTRAIGTTKRGIGPAYAEKVQRSTAIRVGDLIRPDALRSRIDAAVSAKRAMFDAAGLGLDADELFETASAWGDRMRPMVVESTSMLHDALSAHRSVLIEGANATLLDVDHGTYPYVTSSNASVLGICAGAGLPPRAIGRVVGVVKAYCTRVGGGPFPSELDATDQEREIAGAIREKGREFGTTTGRPRRVGWLDLVALRYAARLNGVDAIAVMLLDVLDELDQVGLVEAYEIDGERVEAFPSHTDDLARARPVVRMLDGFGGSVSDARRLEDLPAGARAYLDAVAEAAGVPVGLVSLGPGREQTITTSELSGAVRVP